MVKTGGRSRVWRQAYISPGGQRRKRGESEKPAGLRRMLLKKRKQSNAKTAAPLISPLPIPKKS